MNYRTLHAFITGGTGGLGKAFATALLERKAAKICLLDISSSGREVVKELSDRFPASQVEFYKADVVDHKQLRGSIDWCIEKFGYLNLIVNNAGITSDDKNMEQSILAHRINLEAVFYGTRFGMDVMNPYNGGKGGMVINVASMAGILVMPQQIVYSGTKAGVVHMSRAAGDPINVSRTGVKVNCICPSFTETPILDGDEHVRDFIANVAQQQILPPEYVAEGFIQLLENGESGRVMRVTPQKGIDYKELNSRKPKSSKL